MRLLRYKGVTEPGTIRWVDQKGLDAWREKVIAHANSTDLADRGRYRYQSYIAPQMPEPAEPVTHAEFMGNDTVRLEKPAPSKPEEGRIVVDEMVRTTVAQWLHWRRADPDLFWRKVLEAKEATVGFDHLTVEQAAEQIVALCRKVEEMEAQATYGRRGIGGGWKGPVLRS